jgi:hypothetical protein
MNDLKFTTAGEYVATLNSDHLMDLAKDAGFYFYDMHDVDGDDLGETVEADSWGAVTLFATAIVNECATKLEHDGMNEAASRLKNHFGLK